VVCAKSQSCGSFAELHPFLPGKRKGTFCVLGCYIDDSADHGRKTSKSITPT
jgi:hypothetical protein